MKTRPNKPDYTIKGQLQSRENIDFKETHLAVHALVEGQEVARSEVDDSGCYALRFNTNNKPPNADLCLLPAEMKHGANNVRGVGETVRAHELQSEADGYVAVRDLRIGRGDLHYLREITADYRIWGAVYIDSDFNFYHFQGAKIEFYEVDPARLWLAGQKRPIVHETYLGSVVTDRHGGYDFTFRHTYPRLGIWPGPDTKPDILARIFQFVDGDWIKVFEHRIYWDITKDSQLFFAVPEDKVHPGYWPLLTGPKPDSGFELREIGLLPVTGDRINKGYASAQEDDSGHIGLFWGKRVYNQPFGGKLRIYGLFAESPEIPEYKVQFAETDENGNTEGCVWQDVTDPLHNRKYENRAFVPMVLGPNSTKHRYRNIDIEEHDIWQEPALKVVWETANVPDGYYVLRIIGYNSKGEEEVQADLPVLRIDNTPPQIALSLESPKPGPCGQLILPENRKIELKVTVEDPMGHVLAYDLRGVRGAGLDEMDPSEFNLAVNHVIAEDKWKGTEDTLVYEIPPLDEPELQGCKAMAYRFTLRAWSRATNCYQVWTYRPEKQVSFFLFE